MSRRRDGVPILNGRQLSTDAQGNLWTVSDNTLMRWNAGTARTWLPPGISATEQTRSMSCKASLPEPTDRSGSVRRSRVAASGLLHLVDDKLQPFVVPGLDGRKLAISLVFVDRQNTLWVGTQDEGLYRLHDGTVSRFRARDGLSGDTVQNFFEDREGTLWVLTTRGIEAFRDLRVISVTSREGLSADLANAVLAAARWHGRGSTRGTRSMSCETEKSRRLSSKNGLPGEEVTALFEDRAGTFWVGVDRDLNVFEHGKFAAVRRPDGSPLGGSRGIVEDSSGDLWAITAKSVRARGASAIAR